MPTDLERLKEIHEQHFKHEFNFPDFYKYVCAFVVEDDEGIITAGGIRTIAECVLVTDLSRKPLDRKQALLRMLDANSFVAGRTGFDQIYVWSRNVKYTNRLKRTGFRSSEGDSLILDL